MNVPLNDWRENVGASVGDGIKSLSFTQIREITISYFEWVFESINSRIKPQFSRKPGIIFTQHSSFTARQYPDEILIFEKET